MASIYNNYQLSPYILNGMLITQYKKWKDYGKAIRNEIKELIKQKNIDICQLEVLVNLLEYIISYCEHLLERLKLNVLPLMSVNNMI